MKTTVRLVVASVAVVVAGCSSSGSGGGGGSSQIATIPGLGSGVLPEAMIAGPGGVALTLFSLAGAETIITSTPGGSVATAYTAASGDILTYAALDDRSLYYDADKVGTGDALYSVPIGGGTPVQVLTAASGDVFQTFAIGTDTIYLEAVSGTGTPSTWISSIHAVSKASPQLGAPIYTAAAGQSVDNLRLDGTTLYWSETERAADEGPVTVRSATVAGAAGTLSPSSLGTLPGPAVAAELVATEGTAVMANLATSSGSATADGGINVAVGDGSVTIELGIYAFSAGSAPALVFSGGSVPLAAADGQLYYNTYSGIVKAPVTAAGVGAASTVVPHVTALQMASDSMGSVYYVTAQSAGLFKL